MRFRKTLIFLFVALIAFLAIGFTGCDCDSDWDGHGTLIKKDYVPERTTWLVSNKVLMPIHHSASFWFTVEYIAVSYTGEEITKTVKKEITDERVYNSFEIGDKVFYNKETRAWLKE